MIDIRLSKHKCMSIIFVYFIGGMLKTHRLIIRILPVMSLLFRRQKETVKGCSFAKCQIENVFVFCRT